MSRALGLMFALGALLACRGTSQKKDQQEVVTAVPARSAPAPVTSAAAAAVAAPAELTESLFFAGFEKGRLDECAEMTFVFDNEQRRERVRKAVEKLAKEQSKSTTRIRKPCADQFADRPPLATCVMPETAIGDASDAVKLRVRSYYYSVSTTVDRDSYMKECLDRGGNWTTAPRDESATARERLRQRVQQLQDVASE